MIKCRDVMDVMERIAPKKLAEDWDNPGLLVGSPNDEVRRVLVCLDVREMIVKRAAAEDFQMIVAHHPVIFRGLKKLRTDLPDGRLLGALLRAGVAVFAAHTNLDSVEGGVNDVLAARIGLNPETIAPLGHADELSESLGRVGKLPAPMEARAFAEQVKKGLGAINIRFVSGGDRPVKKVGLCSGSGAEFIERAAFLGCDAFVTGDVRYHDAQRAAALGIHVVDAGHFATEQPVVEILAKRLAEELGDKVEIVADAAARDFFEIL